MTRDLMDAVLPDAMVAGYQHHVSALSLPDPNDRHVVAAAIEAQASLIMTWNRRDFPVQTLKTLGLRRMTPDTFLLGLFEQIPDLTLASLANARRNLIKTRGSASGFVDI